MTEELKQKALEWCETKLEHSYADNEEQLIEDCVKAYIAGHTDAQNTITQCNRMALNSNATKKNHWYEMYELECLKTKSLQEVIEKNEYYQNGYRTGKQEEMVKYETKLFEAEGKVEVRDVRIADLEQQKKELLKGNKELKILISSLVYEINQIWDINEMNDDLRKHAEKIDREVTLSKMADDNRIVLNALGFALVPLEPKVDVKEV